jgi:hypothetical protein
MFYMLANAHHQITAGEVVLPPPHHFWYFLLDLPYGIQNAVASSQLELEQLISREAPRGIILLGAGSDVPSLHNFL